MFEHLIDFDPEVLPNRPRPVEAVKKADPTSLLNAKINTADWLKQMGAVDSKELATALDTKAAQETFANLVSASPEEITHTALAQVKTPAAVQHLVGMLTAYDWEFVNQAKELRGYAVAKILEDCENPKANIRLKALGLLGKVTEVGLFTDKVEIKQTAMTDAEVEQRIKDKLNKFMGVIDVIDVATGPDDIPENGSSYNLTPETAPDEPVQADDADQA